MADEQTIYLSPEEELTSVRERLERTQARRIILVIPQQTSLRSHVGWRLIHARMRELGKELLVISPDRQVRAVARAAGFKVAETQEPSSNRPRLSSSSRPGGINTRGGARSRVGGSRGAPQSQPPQQSTGRRRPTPGASRRPAMPPPTPIGRDYEEEATLEHPRQSEPQPSGNAPIAPATLFGQPPEQFSQPYDFHINTTPSVRPSVPHLEEEEDENIKDYEDYRTARDIRASASGGPQEKESALRRGADQSRASAASRWDVDPYAYLEEEQQQQTRLPEQRGSVRSPLDELEADVPDISDRSTEIMPSEIEDLGDMGALEPPAREEEIPSPRPRQRPRTGQMPPSARRSPRAPRSGLSDLNDDEDLLALPNRPAQSPPSSRSSRDLASARARSSQPLAPGAGARARSSQPLAPGAGAKSRQSQALAPGGVPQAGSRMRVAPTPAPAAQRAPNRQLIPTPSTPSRQRVQRPPRRVNRGLIILCGIVVVLLAAAFLLLYLVPTATVTLSLQARAFSQNVQLNATTDPNATLSNKVPAQTLRHDFSASGQGTASGTTKVGNAKAQGLVTFTNNGTANVVIPTGTIIATASGIQFATGAEVVVPPPPNNTFPAVPVSAQQAGEIGNVGANAITIIPSTSLNSIARYNNTSASSLNLVVTNAKPTSGGGAANVPAVTTRDLQALVRTLHDRLKQEVSTWLAGQIHSGDIRATPVPDVLNSTGPLPQEQLSGAPGAGQPASNGTFSGTLSLHISVLVARAAALQAAAGAQLNAAATRLRPASMLATHLPVTLTNSKSTSSKDGTSLAISARATGEIVRQISAQEIGNALTGKGVGQVASDLKASLAQAGVQDVQVSVFPSFLSIMPLQAGRIQVILNPVMQVSPGNVPNG